MDKKQNENLAGCTGACLLGKCPHKVCLRYLQKKKKAVQLKAQMNILTMGLLPDIKSDKTGVGAAVDIGTTTVVLYLYDLASGKNIGIESRLNAQATLGVDVISRIKYCSDYTGGLSAMQEAIITEINDLLSEVTEKAGIGVAEITHMTITGNTTMLHLFAGLSPVSMGVSPFTPASLFGVYIEPEKTGIAAINAKIYITKCLSAFVGGDITSAILASGMADGDDLCLLLDIGTNGEVALGNRHNIYATSTAAGPAFEGAQISCGMAGVSGAISGIKPYKGDVEISTVSGAPAVGVCGSGLLDAAALFIDAGLIDETGRIADVEEAPENVRKYLTKYEGEPALKIYEGITLTQKDIREIQTAKAAIAAGVLSLLHHAGKEISDIKTVYLAGGFGNFMDERSALRIGLLPKETEGKIKAIGNAAGTGAIMALINDEFKKANESIVSKSEHVELGGNPFFMDKYIDSMYF